MKLLFTHVHLFTVSQAGNDDVEGQAKVILDTAELLELRDIRSNRLSSLRVDDGCRQVHWNVLFQCILPAL